MPSTMYKVPRRPLRENLLALGLVLIYIAIAAAFLTLSLILPKISFVPPWAFQAAAVICAVAAIYAAVRYFVYRYEYGYNSDEKKLYVIRGTSSREAPIFVAECDGAAMTKIRPRPINGSNVKFINCCRSLLKRNDPHIVYLVGAKIIPVRSNGIEGLPYERAVLILEIAENAEIIAAVFGHNDNL